MSVKKTEKTVYIEKLFCDKCGSEMKFNGTCYATLPENYIHECQCGYRTGEDKIYPSTVYEDKKPDGEK